MKEYIGDSVYVDVENGMLHLTCENGLGPSESIYLEEEVYQSLVRYHDRMVEKHNAT
jgi:hypothetical protein